MHLGHCPFTYSTERALLLASARDPSPDNRVKNYITSKVGTALSLMPNGNKSNKRTQQILGELFKRQDYKLLYKCFSASLLVKKKHSILKTFDDFSEQDLEKAVLNLMDKKSPGYKYLDLADTADFVRRKTTRFTLELHVSISLPSIFLADFLTVDLRPTPRKDLIDYDTYEGRLLKVSLDYLNKRFYETPTVVWFSSLSEKILAFLINHESFDLTWLRDFTDDQFKQRIFSTRNKFNGMKLPQQWAQRARDLLDNKIQFEGVLTVDNVEFPRKTSAIDVESMLAEVEKDAKRFLSYPFDRGILLVIQWLAKDPSLKYSIRLFQDQSKKDLLPLLQVIRRLSQYIEREHVRQVRDGLGAQVSWSKQVRFDSARIENVLIDTIKLIDQKGKNKKHTFADRVITQTSRIPQYEHQKTAVNVMEQMITMLPEQREEKIEAFETYKRTQAIECLLSLPVKFLQLKSTAIYSKRVPSKLLEQLETENDAKGNIFETLCIIDRIRKKRGVFQFFLLGQS